MEKRLFSLLKRGMAVTLAMSLVTGLMQTGFSPGKEAEAAGTSSVMGSDNYVAPASIEVGKTYKFGGYSWIAAGESENKVVLQSKGVTSGDWPGRRLWGNSGNYPYDIDGADISSYDTKTQNYIMLLSMQNMVLPGFILYLCIFLDIIGRH